MPHHRNVLHAPSTPRSKPQTAAPESIDLGSALTREGRHTAITRMVDAVHAHRESLGKSGSMIGVATVATGRVTITGRMCQHSDAVKLDIRGPHGHREVCVPWKRGRQEKVEEAGGKLKEVSEVAELKAGARKARSA